MQVVPPEQLHGDPGAAKIFQCLTNPYVPPDSKDSVDKRTWKSNGDPVKPVEFEQTTLNFKHYREHYWKTLLEGVDETKIPEIPVCNLEIFPYASERKSDISFKNLLELTTTAYVAAVLAKRILADNSSNNKPWFVFRSWGTWRWVINWYFPRFGLWGFKDIPEEWERHFLVFSSQNGHISADNLTYAIKIRAKDWDEIDSIFAPYRKS